MFQLNELKGIKICAKCATRIGCIAFYLAGIPLLQTELFALQTELFSGIHLLKPRMDYDNALYQV